MSSFLRNDGGGRQTMRNGFCIARSKGSVRYSFSPQNNEDEEVLYEWMNVKRYFGKKMLKKASLEKVAFKLEEAMRKILK